MGRRSTHPIAVAMAILICGVAGVRTSEAQAEKSPPGKDASQDRAARATQLAAEGLALLQKGEIARALERFDQADALFHTPVLSLYRARCLRDLRRDDEALALYRRIAAEDVAENAPDVWRAAVDDASTEGAEEQLRQAQAAERDRDCTDALIILEHRAELRWLVAAARLRARCQASLGRLLAARETLRDAYARADRVDAAADLRAERASLRDELALLDQRIPRLVVVVRAPREGVVVSLDGRPVPLASAAEGLDLDPGRHSLRVERPGHRTEQLLVLAEAEEHVHEVAAPPPSAEAPRGDDAGPLTSLEIGAVTAGGVGLAALVVATVAGVVVLQEKGDLDRQCGFGGDPASCTTDGKAAADRLQAIAAASTVGFAIAGVAAPLSIALVVVDRSSTPVEVGRGIVPTGISMGVAW